MKAIVSFAAIAVVGSRPASIKTHNSKETIRFRISHFPFSHLMISAGVWFPIRVVISFLRRIKGLRCTAALCIFIA